MKKFSLMIFVLFTFLNVEARQGTLSVSPTECNRDPDRSSLTRHSPPKKKKPSISWEGEKLIIRELHEGDVFELFFLDEEGNVLDYMSQIVNGSSLAIIIRPEIEDNISMIKFRINGKTYTWNM